MSTVSAGSPLSLDQPPGSIQVHLRNRDALFDRTSTPEYPHTGPMVEQSVARFLLDCAREQLNRKELEVVIALDEPPLPPSVEADTGAELRRYFAVEAELSRLELRVNRSEGMGSLRYAIPFVVVALLVAGLFYTQLGAASGASYLEALTYLVFITIVWVMLWDPLEVLLFNSYLIRRRVRALRKLARAPVRFTYPRVESSGPDASRST